MLDETCRITSHGREDAVQGLRSIDWPHCPAVFPEPVGNSGLDVRRCASGKNEHELVGIAKCGQILVEEPLDARLMEVRVVRTSRTGEIGSAFVVLGSDEAVGRCPCVVERFNDFDDGRTVAPATCDEKVTHEATVLVRSLKTGLSR